MRSWRGTHRAAAACLAAALTGGCAGDAPEAGLLITHAKPSLVGERYRISVSLDIRLSPGILEALHNGVPITLLLETRLRQPRDWLWPRTLVDGERRYTLSYQSLSAQYVIRWPGDAGYRAYPSRLAALAALESPASWAVGSLDGQTAGPGVFSESRVRIDLQALPAPLRLVAYFSADWRIGSGWHREKLDR